MNIKRAKKSKIDGFKRQLVVTNTISLAEIIAYSCHFVSQFPLE
ncbi:MAG: hypothetical protein U0U67_05465 [Chitinophagales bacterium]